MTEKCESCRRGFNGRNGNGYMPCGCHIIAANPSPKQSKAIKEAFGEMCTTVVRPQRFKLFSEYFEEKPKFVPPPPLTPIITSSGDGEFKVIKPYHQRIALIFILGLVLGIVGGLYATNFLP